jgi:hypothetical protein
VQRVVSTLHGMDGDFGGACAALDPCDGPTC